MDGNGETCRPPDDAWQEWTTLCFAPPPPPVPDLPLAPRRWIALAVLALHIVFAWMATLLPSGIAPRPETVVTRVEFVLRPPPVKPAETKPAPIAPTPVSTKPASRENKPMVRRRKLPSAAAPVETALSVVAVPLYNVDGSLRVPDDLLAQIDAKTGAGRVFEYQIPGLEEAGTFMDRPPALVYEATMFDEYWQPDQNLLDELLEKAVEKTSPEFRIPIPGRPGSKIVCRVVLLAMGGGCAVVNNNDGYVVSLDDPDTLNEEEARQCQAWWDRIVGANSQAQWRKTRQLYEEQCRKPLESKPPQPPAP